MEAKLFTFCLFCLMALATSSPLKYPSSDRDDRNYDLPADFFRLLLLSRYGMEAPDYTDPDQIYNNDEMPDTDDFTYDQNNAFRQAVQQYAQEHPRTTVGPDAKLSDQSSTTAGPDVLASMPPVTPDKGQKEYVMLRPPVDNHHKIEHWMHAMADQMMASQ